MPLLCQAVCTCKETPWEKKGRAELFDRRSSCEIPRTSSCLSVSLASEHAPARQLTTYNTVDRATMRQDVLRAGVSYIKTFQVVAVTVTFAAIGYIALKPQDRLIDANGDGQQVGHSAQQQSHTLSGEVVHPSKQVRSALMPVRIDGNRFVRWPKQDGHAGCTCEDTGHRLQVLPRHAAQSIRAIQERWGPRRRLAWSEQQGDVLSVTCAL